MRLLSTILLLLAGLFCRAESVAEVRVLLLPMELTGPATANWLPDALRQNMVQEMAKANRLVIVASKEAAATSDPEQARTAGQQHRADLVIFGSCQVNNADVRLMGMVMEVKSGKVTGVAKMTGTMRDVFGLEDQFAARCKQLTLDAIGEHQPKGDPVAAFANNLNKPAIIPQNAIKPAVYPWDVFDPELQWARDNMTYGRRSNTDYYTYPLGSYYGTVYGGWGVWGVPAYGWNLGRGWYGYPMNVGNNTSMITSGRSYMSGTSIRWSGNYTGPKGNVQVNVGQ